MNRIVAEGGDGSFGLLPHRLDCVTSLVPGFLIYETEADGIVYVAADAGVLVKDGPSNPQLPTDQAAFLQQVEAKTARKLRARQGDRGVWFGLGMSGLVGWSVAVPRLLGAVLGLWLDRRHPGVHSWTAVLLQLRHAATYRNGRPKSEAFLVDLEASCERVSL
jgi:predicted F0F1-ATPase subunit